MENDLKNNLQYLAKKLSAGNNKNVDMMFDFLEVDDSNSRRGKIDFHNIFNFFGTILGIVDCQMSDVRRHNFYNNHGTISLGKAYYGAFRKKVTDDMSLIFNGKVDSVHKDLLNAAKCYPCYKNFNSLYSNMNMEADNVSDYFTFINAYTLAFSMANKCNFMEMSSKYYNLRKNIIKELGYVEKKAKVKYKI